MIEVKASCEFDGQKFFVKHPILNGEEAIVEVHHIRLKKREEPFSVPIEYLPLLLNNETRQHAVAFCEFALQQRFTQDDVVTDLLKLVAKKGFTIAEAVLDNYIKERPFISKVQVYQHSEYGREYAGSADFTDGLQAFEVEVPPLPHKKYPKNIYVKPESLSVSLTRTQYKSALKRIDSFFTLLQKIWRLTPFVTRATAQKITDAFFNNRTECTLLLSKFSKLANERAKRNAVYDRFNDGKALEIEEGYLVYPNVEPVPYSEREPYFINKTGEVKEIKKGWRSKKELYKLYLKGIKNVELEDCEITEKTRAAIAKALKEVAPELALILLP
jgi:hypothetical protein